MNLQEAIEFFNKFSIESLESLDLVLPNDPILNSAYISVYNKKFEEVKDEYEGMNEYDNITKKLNFNIKELNNLNIFNKKELELLNSVIDKRRDKNEYRRIRKLL